MSDLIRREDALRVTLAYSSSYSAEQAETAIRALPAVQPDAADIREAALREAVKALRDWQDNLILCGYTETSITVGMAADLIFALIDKPAKGGDA